MRRNNERFLEELAELRASFLIDLELLEDYYEFVSASLRKTRRFDLRGFQKSTRKETNNALKAFSRIATKQDILKSFGSEMDIEVAKDALKKPDNYRLSISWQPNKEGEPLFGVMKVRNIPQKYRGFLNDLVVVHAMTLLEGFIKSYLSRVFEHKPQFLKSNRQVSVEKLIGIRSGKSLRRLLIDKEIESIGYKSITKLADYLDKHFGIDMTKQFNGHTDLLRLSDFRNFIVHVDSIDDHVRHSKSKKAPTQFKSNSRTVKKGIGTVSAFVTFIHDAFPKKLKLT